MELCSPRASLLSFDLSPQPSPFDSLCTPLVTPSHVPPTPSPSFPSSTAFPSTRTRSSDRLRASRRRRFAGASESESLQSWVCYEVSCPSSGQWQDDLLPPRESSCLSVSAIQLPPLNPPHLSPCSASDDNQGGPPLPLPRLSSRRRNPHDPHLAPSRTDRLPLFQPQRDDPRARILRSPSYRQLALCRDGLSPHHRTTGCALPSPCLDLRPCLASQGVPWTSRRSRS